MEVTDKFITVLTSSIESGSLRKISFSRYDDKLILRASARLFDNKSKTFLQIERFTSDGKAYHENVPIENAVSKVMDEFAVCRQIDVTASNGSVEIRRSLGGKVTYSGKLGAADSSPRIPMPSHDRKKQHILYEGDCYDFLVALGVTDGDGRIFDRKRSKFRQIDRFLQYINDIYPRLPSDNELYVLDLCCGKSYLTFAAYWYLTAVKNRKVSMLGADRKEDVIEFCSELAARLNYSGLKFLCCDINELKPDRTPSLVLSLHACDIATDIVLTTAARLGADVILSTPCCHHQVMSQLNEKSSAGADIKPILQHSLLAQKVAVALTDALRCKRLQAAGYDVDVTELIDPEDTPKNLMIRAVKVQMSDEKKQRYLKEFNDLSEKFGVDIFGGSGLDLIPLYICIFSSKNMNLFEKAKKHFTMAEYCVKI